MRTWWASTVQMILYALILLCSGIGYFSFANQFFAEPDAITYARTMLVNKNGMVKRALFAPDDNIKKVLLGLIMSENRRISLAIYALTDRDIARALLEAHRRGVTIEIVADRSQASSQWSKIRQLGTNGILIYIYPTELTTALMHDKFIVFHEALEGRMIVLTGSYNFTRSASYFHQENVVILDDVDLVKSYHQHFQILKSRSMIMDLEQLCPGGVCKKRMAACA